MDVSGSQSTKVDSWYFENGPDYVHQHPNTGSSGGSKDLNYSAEHDKGLNEDPEIPKEVEINYPQGISLVLIMTALSLGLFEASIHLTPLF